MLVGLRAVRAGRRPPSPVLDQTMLPLLVQQCIIVCAAHGQLMRNATQGRVGARAIVGHVDAEFAAVGDKGRVLDVRLRAECLRRSHKVYGVFEGKKLFWQRKIFKKFCKIYSLRQRRPA